MLSHSISIRPHSRTPTHSIARHSLATTAVGNSIKPRYVKNQRFNETTINCCVSAALAVCIEVLSKDDVEMSMLFHYYNVVGGSGNQGMYAIEGVLSARNKGVCRQSLHSYPISFFGAMQVPSPQARRDGLLNRLERNDVGYEQLGARDFSAWKKHLNSKEPLLLTFNLYYPQYNQIPANDNIHPDIFGPQQYFSHAVVVIGYCDFNQRFLVQDCQGAEWADSGKWYLPFELAAQLSFTRDVFAIRSLLKRR